MNRTAVYDIKLYTASADTLKSLHGQLKPWCHAMNYRWWKADSWGRSHTEFKILLNNWCIHFSCIIRPTFALRTLLHPSCLLPNHLNIALPSCLIWSQLIPLYLLTLSFIQMFHLPFFHPLWSATIHSTTVTYTPASDPHRTLAPVHSSTSQSLFTTHALSSLKPFFPLPHD